MPLQVNLSTVMQNDASSYGPLISQRLGSEQSSCTIIYQCTWISTRCVVFLSSAFFVSVFLFVCFFVEC